MSRVSGGEPRTPHSLVLAIDDIHHYSDGISHAFDAANELIASNSPVDEGFASEGSASTHADLDRIMQDLDLELGVLRGHVAEIGLVKFHGLETISDRLTRKLATCVKSVRLVAEVAFRSGCFRPEADRDKSLSNRS